MKKILLSIIAVLCCFTASAVGTQPSVGDGSQVNPYQIATLDNLLWFADHVNSGNASACAMLTADITMNTDVLDSNGNLNSGTFEAWTPIGTYDNAFAGTFDGNGHAISGLYINDVSKNYVALFGRTLTQASIHDLGIKDSYFRGNSWVAGFCGDLASGHIENCWNGATVIGEGSVEGWPCAGGIAASCWTDAYVTGCYNIGKVAVESDNKSQCGGICGTVAANTHGIQYSISNCVSLEGKCDWAYNLYGDAPISIISNVFVKDAEDFASGEVCWILNGNQRSATWRQQIGTDDFPTVTSDYVVYEDGYNFRNETVCEHTENHLHTFEQGTMTQPSGTTINCWHCTSCGKDYQFNDRAKELVGTEPTQPSAGDGSQVNPYQIATLENLLWFANHVNSGNASACAILMADITMNTNVLSSYGYSNSQDFVEWTPIGGRNGKDFGGDFDGNGHTVSGLFFNNTEVNNVGLFGKAVNNAHIHDLGIKDSYFNGKDHVGGICGDFASGLIENCWNGATADARDWNAGGISGSCWIYASIRDCYNIGRIFDNDNPSFGGICGAVYANASVDYTISNCYTLYGKCDKGVYGSLEEGCPASKINHSFVKNDEAFASGEICYQLNHGVTDGSQKWYQTLNGTDDFPVLDNSHGTVFYGYDGDVLKYSNTPISVGATHRDVCAATCNSVGYTMECWEDTRSGRVFADEACATELNAAYVTTYSPVMTMPEYDCNLDAWRWEMQDESVTYDGVTFINALKKVYPNEASYISSEYVWFKVKDASAKNVRLKWHLDKNTFNGELYYKINDGDETKIDISPEMWVQNLPDLQQDDKVTVYYRITSMWSFPLTWTMSLEYCPGHNLQHNPAMAATCTEKGNYENWYCTRCNTHFADAECTTVMTDWEIPALGHTTEYRAQKAATCTEDGYTVNHWHCTVCGRNYADVACTNLLTEDVVLPKINHQHKQHHDRLEATCLTAGNIEYWHCPDCNTHYTDEACTASTTEITIAALGHDFTHTPYTTSTCTSEGVVEHWHCGRCGHDFNVGDQMASEDHVIDGNITVPLKESDVILVGMDGGATYDDCHTFTPPTEGEGETLIATVTFVEETVMMKIKHGETTPYSLNDERPLETFFAHTFSLTAGQDPVNTADYYVTFYTSEGAYKVPEMAQAYTGSLDDEQLMMTDVGNIIHKSEAVVLKANQSDITLMPSCNKASATESNDLIGTDVAKTLGEGEFALSFGDNGVGFCSRAGESIGDNEAYLTDSPDVEYIEIVVYDGVLVKITNQDDSIITLYGLKKVEFIKENGTPAVRVTRSDNSNETYLNPKKVDFGK